MDGLTHVTQDYVKAIYVATEWGGQPVSVTGLAHRLGVAASTASENIRRLGGQGLVEHVPYAGVSLTDKGRASALEVVRRHRLLETYLHDRLGFDWDEVDDEAEQLEHAVSTRLIQRIDEDLGFPKTDPHGDPIPAADGSVHYPAHVLLDEVEDGHAAQILRISDRDAGMLRFLEARGIAPGATVTVQARSVYAGTMRVRVDRVPDSGPGSGALQAPAGGGAGGGAGNSGGAGPEVGALRPGEYDLAIPLAKRIWVRAD